LEIDEVQDAKRAKRAKRKGKGGGYIDAHDAQRADMNDPLMLDEN
jgi:hypothetical protein